MAMAGERPNAIDQMRRREFITLLGGAAAWPLAARAQQPGRMRQIGVLEGFPEDNPDVKARVAGFRQQLEQLGWVAGRNLHIEYRFAPAGVHIQTLAKELVSLRPDVILAQGTASAAALQRESRTIPIVFVGVSDPIGSGFVTSLARPGSNLTGLLLYEASITGKWLAMLKDIAPRLSRVAFLASPKTMPYDYFLSAAESAARALAIELVPLRVENAAEIEHGIDLFAQKPNGGLVFPADTTTHVHLDLVVALAARHRLPAVYAIPAFVAAGGLMFYGTDLVQMYQQSAFYIDRILRGARPDELPVQAPTKYRTVLNLRAAKALGLSIPAGLLVAADEVIE
jgi:putative ABC transport system substrate-binding protein